jgi:hypothetical protein
MELIRDLGMRPRDSGGTYQWGLYRCHKELKAGHYDG